MKSHHIPIGFTVLLSVAAAAVIMVGACQSKPGAGPDAPVSLPRVDVHPAASGERIPPLCWYCKTMDGEDAVCCPVRLPAPVSSNPERL